MSKYTFMNLVLDVLNECHKPLTPEEIWTFAQSRGWDEKLETKGKTPWKTIGAQLYVSIRDGKSIFAKFGKNPVRFGLNSFNEQCVDLNYTGISNNIEKMYHERDLHKLLVSYVNSDSHFKCRAKTIYHEKSHKKVKGAN